MPLNDFINIEQQEMVRISKKYANEKPFPHVVIDNFLTDTVLKKLVISDTSVPSLFDGIDFIRFLNGITKKSELLISDIYQNESNIINTFNAETKHVDYSKHKKFDLDKRIQVLIFLEDDENNKTGLRFYENKKYDKYLFINAKKNRCVIFDLTDFTPHSQVVDQYATKNLKIFSRYYYSSGRPESEIYESIAPKIGDDDGRIPSLKDKIKKIIKLFIPPICLKYKGSRDI